MATHWDQDREERDPEEPEDFDRDDDLEGTETEPCPFCKREVHDRTDICPYCGSFIIREEAKPKVWVVGLIAAIGLLVMFVMAMVMYHQVDFNRQ